MTTPSSADGSQQNARLLVVARGEGYPRWLFLAAIVTAAVLLFYVLETRRERVLAPAISASTSDYPDASNSVPPLAIPDGASHDFGSDQIQRRSLQPPSALGAVGTPPYTPLNVSGPHNTASQYRVGSNGSASQRLPAQVPYPLADAPSQMYVPPPTTGDGRAPSVLDAPDTRGDTPGGEGKERVKATRLVNPGVTVPKGTVIQAVLETALDSTRAGFARALVSRDVFSFDGSSVLIPRGSRIIGEYKSDLNLGQRRVLIQWRRLTRPDGVIVDMDSPSADPLGRAGIAGKVNNHFLTRFGGAILQSILTLGTQLASQRVSRDTIYIGSTGGTQGLLLSPERIQPTVKVKQGSSVSVFVARDLDFSAVQ